MDTIYIIGIFLTFFIAVLLFTKKGKLLPDKILAAWMLFTGLHLLHFYTYTLGWWTTYPHLIGLTAPLPLIHGPMVYLYILSSIRKDNQLRRVDYLHLSPLVFSYLYMFRFFFFYSAEQKQMVDNGELEAFSTFSTILMAGFVVSFITYPILGFKLLARYQKLLNDNFSYDEGINFRWLRNIIISIGCLFVITIVVLALQRILNFNFGFLPDNIFYGFGIILIILFGYFGIRQQNIFSPQSPNSSIIKPGYEKSGLQPSQAEQYHQQLLSKMESDKPYLDSKLSLAKLASIVGVSTNHLSQVINQYETVNFCDFVNKYRVEEFKRQAEKNPHFNILSLALEAGFNSKSAFNLVFKRQTGKTPSQYLSEQ